jgi:hypothetical protein
VLIGVILRCARLILAALVAARLFGSEGNIAHGRYYSPDRRLSFAVPDLGPGRLLEEHYTKSSFAVTFSDRRGQSYQIEGITGRLPPDWTGLTREKRLELFFIRGTLPPLQNASSHLQIVAERWLPNTLGGARLDVLYVPHGSILTRASGNGPAQRLDSVRKVVLFETNGALMQATYHGVEVGAAAGGRDAGGYGPAVQAEVATLLSFAGSVAYAPRNAGNLKK